jgi:peptidoglycan-N-acetylglucosamine deacetylase
MRISQKQETLSGRTQNIIETTLPKINPPVVSSASWSILQENISLLKPPDTRYIALTFDDGPSKNTTPKLLDILKKYDVLATFYVLGASVEQFPDILKRISTDGHEIGNHSWDHKDFTKLGTGEILQQIEKTDALIQKTIWIFPKTLRPPYGAYNRQVSDIAKRPIILWNTDSFDWKNRKIDSNIANVLEQSQEASIILLHDIHQSSVDSVETIIIKLTEAGYKFVTVSKLLEIYQTEAVGTKFCSSGYTCKTIP